MEFAAKFSANPIKMIRLKQLHEDEQEQKKSLKWKAAINELSPNTSEQHTNNADESVAIQIITQLCENKIIVYHLIGCKWVAYVINLIGMQFACLL